MGCPARAPPLCRAGCEARGAHGGAPAPGRGRRGWGRRLGVGWRGTEGGPAPSKEPGLGVRSCCRAPRLGPRLPGRRGMNDPTRRGVRGARSSPPRGPPARAGPQPPPHVPPPHVPDRRSRARPRLDAELGGVGEGGASECPLLFLVRLPGAPVLARAPRASPPRRSESRTQPPGGGGRVGVSRDARVREFQDGGARPPSAPSPPPTHPPPLRSDVGTFLPSRRGQPLLHAVLLQLPPRRAGPWGLAPPFRGGRVGWSLSMERARRRRRACTESCPSGGPLFRVSRPHWSCFSEERGLRAASSAQSGAGPRTGRRSP